MQYTDSYCGFSPVVGGRYISNTVNWGNFDPLFYTLIIKNAVLVHQH